jgi:hypothetical protein
VYEDCGERALAIAAWREALSIRLEEQGEDGKDAQVAREALIRLDAG